MVKKGDGLKFNIYKFRILCVQNIKYMEVWKKIKYYENYLVSNKGNVKRVVGDQAKKERVLKQLNNGSNYMGVSLCKNSKAKRFYVHRLVASAFLDNPESKEEVNHIDGNRQNNDLSNLEWVTRSENHHHRYQVLKQRGVNYGKTGALNWRSKKVYKYDMNMNFICEYPAVLEAQRQTGINSSNIRSVIKGKTKHAGGFKWSYNKT